MLKTTEEDQNLDKNSEVVTDQINPISEEQPDSIVLEGAESKKERVELTPDQRIEVLQELSVLQSLINTSYFLPKLDKGNKGKEQPKITGSIQLNYFNGQQLQTWGERCAYLSSLL